MYGRHVGAANSGLGSDTLWGWHLEIYGLWQLFWPQHLPPTMVMSGQTEAALSLLVRGVPLVKGPRRTPESSRNTKEEHSVLDCLPTYFCTIMSFPCWPVLNVHPLSSYILGVVRVWEHFIYRTHWTLLDVSLKQCQLLCIGVALLWGQGMVYIPRASWNIPWDLSSHADTQESNWQ